MQALLRTECSGIFQASFSPLSSGSKKEFFSDIHCEVLVEILEVKLTKVWSPPVTGSLWSFLFLFLAAPCSVRNFPSQGLNPCPLHWKHGVLTTGPPGKSSLWSFNSQSYPHLASNNSSTTA